ncbi:hypothetical protein Nepgr_006174 [Nepenthes gracilis]|uniref:Uncharacterized protein n=1 Tax=Nepenthes gracilis TaxID=150966 RepID=A0AAD3XH57_NEPGR|nr:hypothetical protein Nepgr_006174 [Nepenthes gracilis]
MVVKHIERTEVSSSGFGEKPDSKISSSNDHHSKQIMTAEGTANWKNSPIPWKTFIESVERVLAHTVENFMHSARKITFNHNNISIATAAPRFFSPDLKTKTQHSGTWRHRMMQEHNSMERIKLCDWKYRTRG